MRSAGERRVPIVVTLHNVMSRHGEGFSAASVKLLREADWITGVSQDVIDDILASDPGSPIAFPLVTNGIEVPEAEITSFPTDCPTSSASAGSSRRRGSIAPSPQSACSRLASLVSG